MERENWKVTSDKAHSIFCVLKNFIVIINLIESYEWGLIREIQNKSTDTGNTGTEILLKISVIPAIHKYHSFWKWFDISMRPNLVFFIIVS